MKIVTLNIIPHSTDVYIICFKYFGQFLLFNLLFQRG